jgi:hypothetical protein
MSPVSLFAKPLSRVLKKSCKERMIQAKEGIVKDLILLAIA